MYQQIHSESSANGITNLAVKVACLFASLMCIAIFKANRATKVPSQISMSTSESLNAPFLPVIGTCWMFVSGSWMLWNREARGFVFRKLFNRDKIRNIECWIIKKERNNKNARIQKPVLIKMHHNCFAENACSNCIAKQVIRKKPVDLQFHTTSEVSLLPGSVNTQT